MGELIFHLLKSSTDRLHEDPQIVSGRRGNSGGGPKTRGRVVSGTRDHINEALKAAVYFFFHFFKIYISY